MGSRRTPLLLIPLVLLGLMVAALLLALDGDSPASLFESADPAARTDPPGSDGPDDESGQPDAATTRRAGRPGRINGDVRDLRTREPAPGRVVTLTLANGDIRQVTTGADGGFGFSDLAPDVPHELRIDGDDHAPVVRPGLFLRSGERLDVGTLWLADGVRVLFEVRSFDGQPLRGATVRAFAQGPGTSAFDAPRDPTPVAVAISEDDGVARFAGLPPGTWTFTAERGGYARRGLVDAVIRNGAQRERFQLALERGYRLDGRVLDAQGEPVSGAPVLAIRRTLPSAASTAPLALRTTTDRDGRFAFAALPAADVVLWSGWPRGRLAVLAAVRLPGVESLDLVLLRGGRLQGVVTAADAGEPLADAEVNVSLQVLGSFVLSFQVHTDAEGRYFVNLPMPGTVNAISAELRGYRTEWAELGEGIAVPTAALVDFDLQLQLGGVITGRVVGPDGPLAGAEVGATNSSWYFSATSDRLGRFVLNGLPQERFFVLANRWGHVMPDRPANPDGALAAGTAPERYVVDLSAVASAEVEIEMRPGGMLRGIVETHAGVPAEGATVSALHGGVATHTDADGSFELGPMEQGAQEIEAISADGGARRTLVLEVPSPPAAIEPVTIRLGPEMRVTGRLFSASGAALEGAYVQVVPWDSSLEHPVTDEWSRLEATRLPVNADGTFDHTIDGGMGPFVVRAGALGHRCARSGRNVVAAEQPEVYVELELDVGDTFTGRVQDLMDGTPVAGAYVAMVAVPDGTDPYAVDYPGAWGPPIVAVADEHGVFRVDGLDAGTHAVRAWSEGHLPDARLVSVPEDSGVLLEVVAALSIAGRVTYEDGGPVVGVHVTAYPLDGGGSSEGRTDADGRFVIPGLTAGEYQVLVEPSADGRQNMVARRMESVSAGSAGVEVAVQRGRIVAGHVLDSDGAPLAGASVSAMAAHTEDEHTYGRITTGPDGSFSLAGLPAGSIRIQLEAAGLEGVGAMSVDVQAPSQGVVLRVPKLDSLSGVVVDADGRAISNQQLLIEPVGAGDAGMVPWAQYLTTGADGSFAANALPGARYTVTLTEHSSLALPPGTTLVAGSRDARLVATIGEWIEGRLVGPDGKPVAGVEVRASRNNTNRFVTTGADGAFKITGLQRGESYMLWTSSQEWGVDEQPTIAAPATAVTLRMHRKLSLAGRILDAQGNVIPNAVISITSESGSTWNVWTGDDGRFDVSGIPEGECTLKVDRFGNGSYVDCGTARAGTTGLEVRVPAR